MLKETNTKTLAEASKYDTFWGIGMSMKDAIRGRQSDWQGKNVLGKLLQEVREGK